MTTNPGERRFPDWARALTSPAAFEQEQARLGHTWTLLGLTTDIPRDNDWFRATLGGRSIFVQRFGDGLRAFENVCVHRFYPIRTKDRGNGVIRCGFHHWQYNDHGLAVGIPKCKEMFGVTPPEMGARLTPVEVATCGMLIFGRFGGDQHPETLIESFGDAFPIVEAICSPGHPPRQVKLEIAANWKLLYHISLDDYHLVAVHPDTFGKGGYLPADAPHYHRLGRHSAYFYGGDGNSLREMADECRYGDYHPTSYRIFQLFPNLLILHVKAGLGWYVILQQYVPMAADRTLGRSWFFPVPFAPQDRTWWHGLLRRIAAPFVPFALPLYMRKIFKEDNSVCEGIQTVAGQIKDFPILGRHEERIAWFEEIYAETMADARSERPNAGTGAAEEPPTDGSM